MVASTPAAFAMDRAECGTIFKEATDLFRQANETVKTDPDAAKDLYGKAARRFELIAGEGGIRNGGLYYNIGNAYFRMDDLGRAILNYRRAMLYTPNDPNLHQNLKYARSRCPDKIEVKQKTRVLNVIFFWHYDLSAKTRAILFASCFVLLWVFALLRIFFPKPWLGGCIGLSAGIALLFFVSIAVEARLSDNRHSGVVVSAKVVARKGDSATFEPSFTEPLHAGTEFDVVEARPDWYQAELMDGRRCWLPANSVELVQ